MDYTSTQLLSDLSTTELIQLKDGIEVEVERFDRLAREHSTDPAQYPQARVFAGWRKERQDLAWKLSVIIEARMSEKNF